MSAAVKLVMVILFWFLIGIVWASLYSTIYELIPTSNPTAIASSGDTWTTLLWIWNIGCVIIAIGGAFCLINDGNVSAIIGLDVCVLSAWLVLILFWAYLYVPINITIPTAFNTTTNEYLQFYNNGTIFFMLFMGLIAILGVGSASFGGRGKAAKTKIIRESRMMFVNEPQYESKNLYRYPKRAKIGRPI